MVPEQASGMVSVVVMGMGRRVLCSRLGGADMEGSMTNGAGLLAPLIDWLTDRSAPLAEWERLQLPRVGILARARGMPSPLWLGLGTGVDGGTSCIHKSWGVWMALV
mmetsp:Transcript_21421/g.43370  ORF Transcript_21421/g.43370 Transcript_21421/m.43370 type:complete len:107 (-) Transcript_21421:125-445(-)